MQSQSMQSPNKVQKKEKKKKRKKKEEKIQSPRSENNFLIVEFFNTLFVRIERIKKVSSMQNNDIPQHRNNIKHKMKVLHR